MDSDLKTQNCAMIQRLLPYLILEIDGEVDSTPLIQGVCAWLLDMGILDGSDDEVISRVSWMAKEGRACARVRPHQHWLIRDAAAIEILESMRWLCDAISSESVRLMASKDENDVHEGRCLNDFLVGLNDAACDSELLAPKANRD